MDNIQKVNILDNKGSKNLLNKSLELFFGREIINLLKTQYNLLQFGKIRRELSCVIDCNSIVRNFTKQQIPRC